MKTRNILSAALRALRNESLGFRFDYPLAIDPVAGPRDSLHYYLYSDRLAWSAMRMDPAGVPMTWYRTTGSQYWPAYIAWYGLVNLGHYLRQKDERFLGVFLRQVDWLERNAVAREDGAIVWPMCFDYRVGTTILRRPWISAHAQGLAISAIVRGWRVTRRPELKALLSRAWRIYELDSDAGGIRIPTAAGALYTEVPGGPAPGILDGFGTSLLALYDLLEETGDEGVRKLLDEGIAGLVETLPIWDYRGKWSWYGCRDYLSPPAYHCINRLLLAILGGLTNTRALSDCAASWDHTTLTVLGRAEILLLFLLTKNAARIKYATWRERSNFDDDSTLATAGGV